MQEKQVVASEEAIPMKQATKIINLSKIHNSPKNAPFENDPPKEESPKGLSPEVDQVPENNEISINYVSTRDIWDRNKIVIENVFSFKAAIDITKSNDLELEPQYVTEC